MKVLSIDPGHTTGIAVYNGEELAFTMTVSAEQILKRDFFVGVIGLAKPDTVLVEGVPSRIIDQRTLEIFSYIRRWFVLAGYSPEIIYPAQWKRLVKRVEIPGQHARDAATMAKWWLETEGRCPIEHQNS